MDALYYILSQNEDAHGYLRAPRIHLSSLPSKSVTPTDLDIAHLPPRHADLPCEGLVFRRLGINHDTFPRLVETEKVDKFPCGVRVQARSGSKRAAKRGLPLYFHPFNPPWRSALPFFSRCNLSIVRMPGISRRLYNRKSCVHRETILSLPNSLIPLSVCQQQGRPRLAVRSKQQLPRATQQRPPSHEQRLARAKACSTTPYAREDTDGLLNVSHPSPHTTREKLTGGDRVRSLVHEQSLRAPSGCTRIQIGRGIGGKSTVNNAEASCSA